jgi:hypothetical protein
VTWVRHYVAGELPPPHSPEDLAGKPITWTIGALNPAGLFFDNAVLAVKSGCPISLLKCKHFEAGLTDAVAKTLASYDAGLARCELDTQTGDLKALIGRPLIPVAEIVKEAHERTLTAS